ncbi:hypothetical protein SMALB_0626 [Streptomyces malaysiensis]|uniref:HTH gntR-type domain-containing protein n=1 Tax=Streptomyces malaysiensis TaxID=92644 RepID=A0A7X6AV18_STRMQ|nr:hypothetical protein [Streptomyces malaysiensis]
MSAELAECARGTRVASEAEIARRFGVGRAAARAAVQELERRFVVRRTQGSGTFVNRRIDYVISRSAPPSWSATIAAAGLPHEVAGAEFARRRVGERAAWVIARHVPAKRYLVATDPAYHALLSPVSVASLKVQGGPMDEREVAEFAAHPLAADAVALRRWDDAAKDPDGPRLTMPTLLAAHARCVAARRV